ncbi:MAG: LysM peptidoglycan-binding domain-containing protein [Phycisphaerae bacterium]|jgi:nucleoid-associated protein YgaU|nr:LysM peptidoglycan-binding domain-containing protein [Phycisphaerae bacterium]
MKRSFIYSLVIGLSMMLAGCTMFQKKETAPETMEDTTILSQVTPEMPEEEAVQPAPEYSAPVAPAGQRIHVVQPKDTIYSLARKYYGDMHQWRKIWQANQDQVPDPNKIKIGQRLIIPE